MGVIRSDEAKGSIDFKNEDLYKKYDYENQEHQIKSRVIKFDQEKINKEIAAMQKRNTEQNKK